MKNLLTLILIAFALNAGAQNCVLIHGAPNCDAFGQLSAHPNQIIAIFDTIGNVPDNPFITRTFAKNTCGASIININDTVYDSISTIWSERINLIADSTGDINVSINVVAQYDDGCVLTAECSTSITVTGDSKEAQQVADIPVTIDNGVQTGVSEFNSKHFLKVFPTTNPIFYVSRPCTVTIYDLAGRLIESKKADSDFAVEGLNGGVYFYRAVSESGTVEGRFVIQ